MPERSLVSIAGGCQDQDRGLVTIQGVAFRYQLARAGEQDALLRDLRRGRTGKGPGDREERRRGMEGRLAWAGSQPYFGPSSLQGSRIPSIAGFDSSSCCSPLNVGVSLLLTGPFGLQKDRDSACLTTVCAPGSRPTSCAGSRIPRRLASRPQPKFRQVHLRLPAVVEPPPRWRRVRLPQFRRSGDSS